jgi:hypothetical protein
MSRTFSVREAFNGVVHRATEIKDLLHMQGANGSFAGRGKVDRLLNKMETHVFHGIGVGRLEDIYELGDEIGKGKREISNGFDHNQESVVHCKWSYFSISSLQAPKELCGKQRTRPWGQCSAAKRYPGLS